MAQLGKQFPAPAVSKGFQVTRRSPLAELAATANGEDRTGDTPHSRLGYRTDSALVAQVSGSGRDLDKGEGRDGVAGAGEERPANV